MADTPGGKRTVLKDILPLSMPLMIQIFPVYACNFQCEFCIHGLDRDMHGYISDRRAMELDLYRKIIGDIQKSGQKIKMLRFAAIGEPLLHRGIAEMVKIAIDANIADSVDIVTNGSLLTPRLSDALIDAGLSRLRISVEGLSGEDYEKRCRCKLDFQAFVDNIAYFYHKKTTTEVYVKIIDYMVQREGEQEKFYSIFGPISDSIAIEHLTPTVGGIDYGSVSGGMALDKGQNNEMLLDAKVCPQPFYMMQINPDGKAVPCCSMKYPAVLGDVAAQSVQEVWQGREWNRFRLQLLQSRQAASGVCGQCSLFRYDLHEEDILDGAAERLAREYCC